jgi:hypothetical protein
MATYDSARSLRLVYTASRISKHARPNQTDLDYWLPKFEYAWNQDGDSGVEYMYQRALGQGAGGADIPPYGPYGRDTISTPPLPYPEESVTPVPVPVPDPIPTPIPSDDYKKILELLTTIINNQMEPTLYIIETLKLIVKQQLEIIDKPITITFPDYKSSGWLSLTLTPMVK